MLTLLLVGGIAAAVGYGAGVLSVIAARWRQRHPDPRDKGDED